jgi:hypothetical protein
MKTKLFEFWPSVFLLLMMFSLKTFATAYVVIGDSHSCGGFGRQLLVHKFGSAGNANTVKIYCVVSGAPNHWLTGKAPKDMVCKTASSAAPAWKDCSTPGGDMPTAAAIIANNPSAQIVVALGTNSLMSAAVPASYKQLADMVKQNNRTCYWIAPPHLNPAQSKGFPAGRIQILENNLNGFYSELYGDVRDNCVFVDSRPLTQPGTVGNETTDGVHRTTAAGLYWANQVAGSFKSWFSKH